MQLEPEARQWCVDLIAEHNSTLTSTDSASVQTNLTADNARQPESVTTSHTADNSYTLGEGALGESCDDWQERAKAAVVAAHEALTPDELAACLCTIDDEARDWYLSLLASHHMSGDRDQSVLDSGSSKHLQSTVCITDIEDRTPLSGFDGSTQWTEGTGYVPAIMYDENTNSRSSFKIDFEDADLMTENLISNILSLGKLLRGGWKFHLEEGDCHGTTPGGAHNVEIQLGIDNILRISHQMRSARERQPLPRPLAEDTVNTVKRSAGNATSAYFHECPFHRGDAKLTHTLKNTKGYLPIRIQTGHCDACAAAKAREFGLSQSRAPATIMPVHIPPDETFDDDNHLDDADSVSDSDNDEL